ncbi:MAG TPA: MBL fold metallo-hydrolase [bacterium]|mgnify:CR=1 FL=1|nr:MBL fold metallo-hydrolase [bacterium]HPS30499.1 MBL fold metallo-hydrolase [bacterium]
MKESLLLWTLLIILLTTACTVNEENTIDNGNSETADCSDDLTDEITDSVIDENVQNDTENNESEVSDTVDEITVPDEDTNIDDTDNTEAPDEIIDGSTLDIEQIYFPGKVMGEAILIIGPDKTSVLIDTANDGQSKQIAEAIVRRTGKSEIDWLIVTHYHNDHIGGFDNLFGTGASDKIDVKKGIIYRGMLDIGSDMPGVEDFNEFCTLTSGELASISIPLCEGTTMPCGGGSGGPWGASSCNGLLKGDLSDSSDDSQNITSFIPIGGGAKIYFTHANGWVAANDGPVKAEDNGITIGWGNTDEENARSLGAVLKWGGFNYVFAGDTQGRDIKMEKFIAGRSDKLLDINGQKLIETTGADAVHLSHHGLASSTSTEWVDWLFPNDGKNRNAIVGTSGIYVTSPAQSVLDSLAPRLGTGMVWANAKAWTSGSSPKLFVANTAVTIHVENNGSQYRIVTGIAPNEFSSETFQSTSE